MCSVERHKKVSKRFNISKKTTVLRPSMYYGPYIPGDVVDLLPHGVDEVVHGAAPPPPPHLFPPLPIPPPPPPLCLAGSCSSALQDTPTRLLTALHSVEEA